MLKEKQMQLKDKINKVIEEFGHMSDIKKSIGNEFLSRNLPIHRPIAVITTPNYLNTLSDSDEDIRFLFIFSVALNNALKWKEIDVTLDVQEYFTQLEYRQWIGYKEEDEPEIEYTVVFENVQQISERMWQTTMTSQRFVELDKNNRLIYNFLNQRSPVITVHGIKMDIDKKSPIDISKRMLEGKQYPDPIKFNVLRNFEEEEIIYDAKNRRLTIKGIINLSDGQHRKIATILTLEKEPEFIYTWPLLITHYTEDEAAEFIRQINLQRKFKTEQAKGMDANKKENVIVDFIMNDKFSRFSKVIKLQKDEIIKLKKGGLVTKNIIADTIMDNYKLDEAIDIKELGVWIIDFMDYLMSLYKNEFILDPYSIQDVSVINHMNIFYGYIALSTELQGNSDWKQLLENKMKSIDFNKENPLWKEIGIFSSKLNKSIKNKIYKYFKEV